MTAAVVVDDDRHQSHAVATLQYIEGPDRACGDQHQAAQQHYEVAEDWQQYCYHCYCCYRCCKAVLMEVGFAVAAAIQTVTLETDILLRSQDPRSCENEYDKHPMNDDDHSHYD